MKHPFDGDPGEHILVLLLPTQVLQAAASALLDVRRRCRVLHYARHLLDQSASVATEATPNGENEFHQKPDPEFSISNLLTLFAPTINSGKVGNPCRRNEFRQVSCQYLQKFQISVEFTLTFLTGKACPPYNYVSATVQQVTFRFQVFVKNSDWLHYYFDSTSLNELEPLRFQNKT